MTPSPVRPSLTVAVIHHQLRGYPEECLPALVADAPPDTEFLFIHGGAAAPKGVEKFPQVRLLKLARGDRAAAKNRAVAEARGEFLLLTTSDTVVRQGTIGALQRFLLDLPGRAAVSAQVLLENGLRRPTQCRLPSLSREFNLLGSVGHVRRLLPRKYKRPVEGPPWRAPAFHATCIMARRETFEAVGAFNEGYRFACEDLEWCWRARRGGAALWVMPDACAFKLAPQLFGPLDPPARVALEEAYVRLAASVHGPAYARGYRRVRKAKSLVKWLISASLGTALCGRSELLEGEAAVHRAIWRSALDGSASTAIPPDLESRVRWELGLS